MLTSQLFTRASANRLLQPLTDLHMSRCNRLTLKNACLRRVVLHKNSRLLCQAHAEHSGTSGRLVSRPLDVAHSLALARHHESQRREALLLDPYAAGLVSTRPTDEVSDMEYDLALNVIATKYIEDCLLNAVNAVNVNTINKGDYRQVVLVGDGMDTRPFRLPWPAGTIIFLVAPSESHELAEAVLVQQGARVPRGCLLRRVNADLLKEDGSFASQLEAAGFQGNKLSVWALQGLHGLCMSTATLQAVLTDVTNMAAFNSLVVGELPCQSQQEANNMLAEFGLLGAAEDIHVVGTTFYPARMAAASVNNAAKQAQRWLFSSQQKRLSLAEMGIFDNHKQAAEELDEDFFDNFS